MGMSYKERGGGRATGLANDFVGWLQQGLNTGSFGAMTPGQQFGAADPMGSAAGISGVLNDILSGGAGQIGGSINEMINRQIEQGALNLRARYGASGGNAFSTGAATTETRLRAEGQPALTQAIGNLQLGAVSQLLPLIAGFASKGITQREGAYQENPWVSALKIAAPIAGSFLAPGLGLGSPSVPSASTIDRMIQPGMQITPGLSSGPNFNPMMYDPSLLNFMRF